MKLEVEEKPAPFTENVKSAAPNILKSQHNLDFHPKVSILPQFSPKGFNPARDGCAVGRVECSCTRVCYAFGEPVAGFACAKGSTEIYCSVFFADCGSHCFAQCLCLRRQS